MQLPTLFIAALGGFVVLHYFLIPRATERWRADSTPGVVGKAVTLGVLVQLRTIATIALVAAALIYTILLLFSLSGPIFRADYGVALEIIGSLRAALGTVSGAFATLTFLLLTGGLIYLGRRATRTAMTERYQAAVDIEVTRLKADFDAGHWEELEPTPEMRALEQHFLALRTLAETTENSAEGAALRAAAQNEMKTAREAWLRADWSRRVAPKWESDDDSSPPATSRWARATNFIFSKGMFRTTADLSKGLSYAALILLFLSLIGLQSAPLEAALERQTVRLSELEVSRDRKDAIESTNSDAAIVIDDAAVDQVARWFEDALLHSEDVRSVIRVGQGASRLRDLHRSAVRRRILEEVATPTTTAADARQGMHRAERLAQHPSLGEVADLSASEREVLDDLVKEADNRSKPRTAFGRRMAADLRQSGVTRTSGWARLQADITLRRAQFGQLASIEDLGANMVGKVLDGLADEAMPKLDGEAGKLLAKVQGKVPSEAVKAMYGIRRDAFLADIARGVDVEEAVSRVLVKQPRRMAMTVAHRAPLHAAFNDLPSASAVAPKLDDYAPRLRWEGPAAPAADIERAVQLARAAPSPQHYRAVTELADNFATYEDFFPGNPSARANLPRTRVMSAYITTLERSGVDPGVTRYLSNAGGNSRSLARMATNARMLRGFSRIGGVLIGVDADSGGSAWFRDIGWRRDGHRLALWLVAQSGEVREVGTFPAATIHQALAYAADDRRVAVTMTTAESSQERGLRVLLHPALIDTPLGLDIIELDRLVDTYTYGRGSATPHASSVAGQVVRARRRVMQAHMMYEVARLSRVLVLDRPAQEKAEDEAALSDLLTAGRGVLIAALSDAASMFDTQRSPLTVKTGFYDPALVKTMEGCIQGGTTALATFTDCIGQNSRAYLSSSDTEGWVLPSPDASTWSGVREGSFVPDQQLGFLRAVTPSTPLRFMLQVSFSSRPFFDAQPGEDDIVSDSMPWEYPSVSAQVHEHVTALASRDATHATTLLRSQEFVMLQRLFRAALQDQLGPAFPLERLILLARETRGDVKRVRTPRWNQERP